MKFINILGTLTLCSGLMLTHVPIAAQQNSTDKIIQAAQQGAIVSLPGIFESAMKELKYTKKPIGDTQLLMSDDPEYVADTTAIVLKEAVKAGDVRLYVYNVNGVVSPFKMPRKIIAVIKNTGDKDMRFRMKRSASMKPSDNYYEVGKMGLAKFFSSKSGAKRSLKPGETILIDPSMESSIAMYNELVHGIYEFHIDQPAEITILQTAPDANYKDAIAKIQNIVPPGHLNAGRGLFSPADYVVKITDTLDTKSGPYVLKVADGKIDKWITGKESNFNKSVELAGNYGVVYDITIPWKSEDGRGLALLTWNLQSGIDQWCGGMANSMVVSKGKFKAGLAVLPSNDLAVKKAPDAILVQVFPAQKGVQLIHLKYSPPGASCLPTPLVFVPID